MRWLGEVVCHLFVNREHTNEISSLIQNKKKKKKEKKLTSSKCDFHVTRLRDHCRRGARRLLAGLFTFELSEAVSACKKSSQPNPSLLGGRGVLMKPYQ